MAEQTIHTIGRRKEAVCRVYIKPGSGKWDVNGRTLGDYFPRPALVSAIQQPFTATDMLGRFDVKANLEGGGQTGQAGALRLAIARALRGATGFAIPRRPRALSDARRGDGLPERLRAPLRFPHPDEHTGGACRAPAERIPGAHGWQRAV